MSVFKKCLLVGFVFGVLVGWCLPRPYVLPAIIDVQAYLNTKGYSITEDGKLGPETQKAWDTEYDCQWYRAMFVRSGWEDIE
tara:strand:+ start:853 stop:1098 length:246 start_codon:yes stop_codon:yes gene_type:complete